MQLVTAATEHQTYHGTPASNLETGFGEEMAACKIRL
jgi:hypothetical protein